MTTVNELELPQIILDLIKAGRWKMPSDDALLRSLFQDFGNPCEFSGPTLYLTPRMQSETSNWINLSKQVSVLRGTPDPQKSPGDIEPSKTVLIGDIGVGWDAPFALDYRSCGVNPSVVHYVWSDDRQRNRWIQVAPTIKSFVGTLEL